MYGGMDVELRGMLSLDVLGEVWNRTGSDGCDDREGTMHGRAESPLNGANSSDGVEVDEL